MTMQKASIIYAHVADILRRARAKPVGPDRNDLRQLAIGLRWFERNGSDGIQARIARTLDAHEARADHRKTA